MEVQWSLIIFTLLVCLSAGMFTGLGILSLLGKGKQLQLPALITAAGATVLGGLASFTHLQHWERFFNGFAHLSSGITQELIAIAVMALIMVIYFFQLRKKGTLPKWTAALAIASGVAVVVVMTTSYLMPARPVWATPLLYAFYLAQALVAGASGLWVVAAITTAEGTHPTLARITLAGGVAVVVSLVAYAAYIGSVNLTEVGHYFDPTLPTKETATTAGYLTQLLAGTLAPYFWASLIVGGVIPATAGFLGMRRAGTQRGAAALALPIVALITALAGGICFRVILYLLGASVFVFY